MAMDNHTGIFLNANGDRGAVECYIPSDFSSIKQVALVIVAAATLTPMTIRVETSYARTGEDYSTHSKTVDLSINTVLNQIYELDISSAVGSLAARDYLGVSFTRVAGQNTSAAILGVKLEYRNNKN